MELDVEGQVPTSGVVSRYFAAQDCNVFLLLTGETKRKFESVHSGGTMDTPDSGKVFQYWHCCGSEDPFDPGCTASPHSSYDDD
ncbi:hypothetical protein Csa_009464 [Cucumis sativus]|nr:hypothetical protein Csa_009464 [Cucumis sativus]